MRKIKKTKQPTNAIFCEQQRRREPADSESVLYSSDDNKCSLLSAQRRGEKKNPTHLNIKAQTCGFAQWV